MKLKRVVVLPFCLMIGVACVWAAQNASTPTPATTPAAPATTPAPAPAAAPAKIEFKNDLEKISYAIGCWLGGNLKTQDTTVDIPLLVQGLTDALKGQARMTDEEVRQGMTAMQTEAQARMGKKRQEEGQKNLVEGKAFLEANAKKEGIKVLADGLQYKVIKEGAGNTPTATDTVKVNYKGTFTDGKEFDKSSGPAEIPLNRVIKGWTEALQLMKVGSKWELYLPAELAYGENGRNAIPPNTVLVFEIELLDIVKPAADAAAPGATIVTPNPSQNQTRPAPKPQ